MTFLSLNQFFREEFGGRVQKIPLDAGLGCPNRDPVTGRGGCIYCNPRGSGTGAWAKGHGIREQLLDGMRWARRRYRARLFMAYFQSYSNTFGSLEQLEALYRQAAAFPEVVGVAIGTRPDCVNQQVLELIARIFRGRMVWMEYGLQSASDETLHRIGRGHSVQAFADAVELTRNFPFRVCAHVMFGLPGEGRREMLATVRFLKKVGIDGIKFHQLYVIKQTRLHRLYERGEYQPVSMEEYAAIVAEALRILPPGTVIQRLTGDPAPGELVAPSWASRKQEIISLINHYMETGRIGG